MAASEALIAEGPTPMPITPARARISCSRARIAVVAFDTAKVEITGTWPRIESVCGWAAVALPQLCPTNDMVLPKAEPAFESTSPIGFPMVDVLLPANSRATGWGQAPSPVTISDPESPPALNEPGVTTTWLI